MVSPLEAKYYLFRQYASIAQLEEHSATNREVGGSNPSGRANKKAPFRSFCFAIHLQN